MQRIPILTKIVKNQEDSKWGKKPIHFHSRHVSSSEVENNF
jgi:hypothetical protein